MNTISLRSIACIFALIGSLTFYMVAYTATHQVIVIGAVVAICALTLWAGYNIFWKQDGSVPYSSEVKIRQGYMIAGWCMLFWGLSFFLAYNGKYAKEKQNKNSTALQGVFIFSKSLPTHLTILSSKRHHIPR